MNSPMVSYVPLCRKTHEGYTFEKWSDEITDNPRVIDPVTTDLTLTAIFQEDTTTPPDLPVITGSILSQSFELSNLNRRDTLTYGDGTNWAYQYDGKGNLESATKTHGTDPDKNLNFSYTYDDNGNRLTANEAGVSKTYTSNELDQYDEIVVNGQSITILYDEDGNPTTHKGWDLTWNAEDRLSTMAHQTEDIIIEFKYDFRNFRIRKKVTVNGSVEKHIAYIYDGNLVSAEIDIKDGSQKVIRRYTWGLDPAGTRQQVGGIGALVGMEVFQEDGSSKKYHMVSDAGGNVARVLQSNDDDSVSLANSYEYDGFGVTLEKEENVFNPFRYNTKPLVDNLVGDNDYDYGYRNYNADQGRWWNQDPIGVEGGINVYNSVSNNMVNGLAGGLSYSSGMDKNYGKLGRSLGVDAYGNILIVEDGEFGDRTEHIRSLVRQMKLYFTAPLIDISLNKTGLFTKSFSRIFLGLRPQFTADFSGPHSNGPIYPYAPDDGFNGGVNQDYLNAIDGAKIIEKHIKRMKYLYESFSEKIYVKCDRKEYSDKRQGYVFAEDIYLTKYFFNSIGRYRSSNDQLITLFHELAHFNRDMKHDRGGYAPGVFSKGIRITSLNADAHAYYIMDSHDFAPVDIGIGPNTLNNDDGLDLITD